MAYGRTGNVTPTAQNFVSVETGTFAHVVSPYVTYVQKLPSDPLAQWIATTSSLSAGSALYAIPFVVTDSVIASASLDLGYSVDNAINGVYINGVPISGNSDDGDYHGEYYFLRSDIATLLRPNSTNWLYLNVTDGGGLSALIFNATITTQGIVQTPSISPAVGGNTGQVTVQVIGSGFQPGAQLSLTGIGSPISGTNPTVVSPNVLTATLNLTGASVGVRTVTVTNPGGTSVTLPNAFTVDQGGLFAVQMQKNGTPAVLGRNETFFITVTNTGTVDSGVIPVVEAIEPWFTLVSASPTPTSIQTAPDVFPASAVGTNYNAFVEWDLPNIPAQTSVNLAYTVTLDPTFSASGSVDGPACLGGFANIAGACRTALNICKSDPPLNTVCKLLAVPVGLGKYFGSTRPIVSPLSYVCGIGVPFCYSEYVGCMLAAGDLCGVFTSKVRASVDPNGLIGPTGYGSQMWIPPNLPMQYALSFENLPTATKPATNVYLTDVFDSSKLDITSLAIGGITFGSTTYVPSSVPLLSSPLTADIDLRPQQNLIVRVTAALDSATNQVTVQFLSLDPATGLEPADPLAGFLPAGVGGTILFAVMPKSGLTTGTVVQDQGSVVFDVNPAISTPTWSNSIDNSAPQSLTSSLSTTQSCPNFNVSWTESDLGSGVSGVTVFASDSGGPFQPWLSNTTVSSAVYKGSVGHQYAFFTIATDNVGNTETTKTTAEASTSVVGSGPCGPPALGLQVTSSSLSGNALTIVLQVTNTGVTDATAVNINQVTARTLSGSGNVSLSLPTLPLSLGPLAVGASQNVTLTLNVPSAVTRFSLVENGNVVDVNGKSYNYSLAEAIIP